jgi:hypothetical protein
MSSGKGNHQAYSADKLIYDAALSMVKEGAASEMLGEDSSATQSYCISIRLFGKSRTLPSNWHTRIHALYIKYNNFFPLFFFIRLDSLTNGADPLSEHDSSIIRKYINSVSKRLDSLNKDTSV